MSSVNFKKGEKVLHAQHGVGKITSIRRRSFSGCPEARYVKLHFEKDGLTMTVLEKDLPNLVRGMISSGEAKELLSSCTDWSGKPSNQWKARANAHQAALDSGDPFQYVKVLKGLAHLETTGTLRSSDRSHMNQSLDLLLEELSCALKQSRRGVRKLLDQAVGVPV